VGIHVLHQSLHGGGVGVHGLEQVFVLTDFGIHGSIGVYPVDGSTLDLAAVSGITTTGLGIVGGQNFGDIAVLVGDTAGALDKIGTLQAALGAIGIQALVLGHGNSQEVVSFDPQITGEGNLTGTVLRTVGVVLHGDGFGLTLGIVGDGQFHGLQNRHDTLCGFVQVFTQAEVQEGQGNGVGALGNTHTLAEIPDGSGGKATAAQTAQGGHTGIIPAIHIALLHQCSQVTLGQHGVVDAQTGELDLAGNVGHGDVFHNPVVQGSVVFKFQGAQGMGDAFQSVLDGMGKVIHGVDAPLVALTVMVHVTDPVDNGVTHIEVAGGQVDLGSQGVAVVLKFAGTHPCEQIQAFLHGTVPVGGDGGGVQIAPVFLELLGGQLADISQALLDQLHSVLVVLLKVVGTIVEPVAPVEAQPVDVFLDGVHKLHVFLGRVGVVHTQVAQTTELQGSAEVNGQGLAVADMQVAVGLRRKTGVNGLACIGTAFSDIFLNEAVDKIQAFSDFSHIYSSSLVG